MEIRQSHSGDGPGCAQVWHEAGAFFAQLNPNLFQLPSPDGLADWFEQVHLAHHEDPSRLFLVAANHQQLRGFLLAGLHEPVSSATWQLQTDLTQRRLVIDALAVAQQHRRAGVGTALLRESENWGREQRATSVSVQTEPNNPLAMPFYEQRMGYTTRSVQLHKNLSQGP